MQKEQPTINQLLFSFLRLGATAFGGPSMVAYIRKLVVEQNNWMDAKEFNVGVAFCQLIPGATAMQMAAYVGFSLRGVTGAAISFIGFGLPAFFLMLFFAMIYNVFIMAISKIYFMIRNKCLLQNIFFICIN